MKKLLASLLLVGAVSAPKAEVVEWLDIYDPTDFTLNAGDTYSYTHDINADGFNPATDTVFYANLRLFIKSDKSDGPDIVDFNWDGTPGADPFLVEKSFYNFDVDAALLQVDGKLKVDVSVTRGSMIFKESHLLAEANSSVPEPGSLGLFGLGIAGLGLALRRRKA